MIESIKLELALPELKTHHKQYCEENGLGDDYLPDHIAKYMNILEFNYHHNIRHGVIWHHTEIPYAEISITQPDGIEIPIIRYELQNEVFPIVQSYITIQLTSSMNGDITMIRSYNQMYIPSAIQAINFIYDLIVNNELIHMIDT